jgi:hypothetical protein
MVSIKKQLEPTKFKAIDIHKSAGILDDFAVRKNVATREGTIEKVPVNPKDIVNKEYLVLNNIDNMTSNKTFNNGSNSISFNFTNPTSQPTYDGAFEIQASGAFSGDLFHVHQHTGNPGATDLCHFEASDADVKVLRLQHDGAGTPNVLTISDSNSDNLTIDNQGNISTAGTMSASNMIKGIRWNVTKLQYQDNAGNWQDVPTI